MKKIMNFKGYKGHKNKDKRSARGVNIGISGKSIYIFFLGGGDKIFGTIYTFTSHRVGIAMLP